MRIINYTQPRLFETPRIEGQFRLPAPPPFSARRTAQPADLNQHKPFAKAVSTTRIHIPNWSAKATAHRRRDVQEARRGSRFDRMHRVSSAQRASATGMGKLSPRARTTPPEIERAWARLSATRRLVNRGRSPREFSRNGQNNAGRIYGQGGAARGRPGIQRECSARQCPVKTRTCPGGGEPDHSLTTHPV